MDPVLKTLPSQAQGLGGLGYIVAEMFQSLADDLAFIIIHQTLKGAAIPVKGCFRETLRGLFLSFFVLSEDRREGAPG